MQCFTKMFFNGFLYTISMTYYIISSKTIELYSKGILYIVKQSSCNNIIKLLSVLLEYFWRLTIHNLQGYSRVNCKLRPILGINCKWSIIYCSHISRILIYLSSKRIVPHSTSDKSSFSNSLIIPIKAYFNTFMSSINSLTR